jgi:hypothetical protein
MNSTALEVFVSLNPVEYVIQWIQTMLSWLIEAVLLPGSRIIQQHAQTALFLYYGPSIVIAIATALSFFRR